MAKFSIYLNRRVFVVNGSLNTVINDSAFLKERVITNRKQAFIDNKFRRPDKHGSLLFHKRCFCDFLSACLSENQSALK